MPPKSNRKSKKQSAYAFKLQFDPTPGMRIKPVLLGSRWHARWCERKQRESSQLLLSIPQFHYLNMYTGSRIICHYICTYCDSALPIGGDDDELRRLQHVIGGCGRQWKKFKKRRQISLRTVLLHHPGMIADVISIILEYVDNGATQSSGKRLQENIALPYQSDHSVN